MKKPGRIITAILSIATLWLFAACGNLLAPPVAPPAPGGDLPAGMGRALVSISPLADERTLMPDYTALAYSFEFSASGKTSVSGSLTEGSAESVDLEAGTWNLVISGKQDDDLEVLTGSLNGITINAGEAKPVDVVMTRSNGAGTLSYSVTFPDAASEGYLRVFNLTGTLAEQVDLFSGTVTDNEDGTKTVAGTLALTGAYYRVGLHLSWEGNILNRTALAHIYPAVTTSVGYDVTVEDFLPAVADFAKESLAEALADINDLSVSEGSSYAYSLPAGTESMGGITVSRADTPVNITIDGGGRTVTLDGTGSLITVGNNVALKLTNLTLQGSGSNNAALLMVNAGGSLELGADVFVVGNVNTSTYGGGVYVANNGTFVMSGGAVSGNTAANGGAVYVAGGSFAMRNNASVSGNTASYGGAVYVAGGSFAMWDNASISGNIASYGGAVYVAGDGTLVKTEALSTVPTKSGSMPVAGPLKIPLRAPAALSPKAEHTTATPPPAWTSFLLSALTADGGITNCISRRTRRR
jgi:hypothetical protein